MKSLFRDVAAEATRKPPVVLPTPRRSRSGDTTSGSFSLAAFKTLRRAPDVAIAPWDALRKTDEATDDRLNAPSLIHDRRAPDGPMSAGELVRWFLDNGTTIEALRAMFPAFFNGEAPGAHSQRPTSDFHEPELWEWNTIPECQNAFDDFHYPPTISFQPHL
jgi:hypothetical protein